MILIGLLEWVNCSGTDKGESLYIYETCQAYCAFVLDQKVKKKVLPLRLLKKYLMLWQNIHFRVLIKKVINSSLIIK